MDNYSSDEAVSWITQYCSTFGRDYFVEVAPEFIEDDFNLTGLSSIVPYYKQALDVILDLEPEHAISPTDIPIIEHAAELLYGLIHARFIITKQGLHCMAEKYEDNAFGSCPRYYCNNMHLIPIGRFDNPGIETVRLYCPCCNDIYLPSSSRYLNIDGAFFGTSFPGLFMKMFAEIGRQAKENQKRQFSLKLFGFKLNESANCGPRMSWLRSFPLTAKQMEEFEKCEFAIPDDADDDLVEEYSSDEEDGIQVKSNSNKSKSKSRIDRKNNEDESRMEEDAIVVDEDIEIEDATSRKFASGGESMMSIAN